MEGRMCCLSAVEISDKVRTAGVYGSNLIVEFDWDESLTEELLP
jgi:hypothetical protein